MNLNEWNIGEDDRDEIERAVTNIINRNLPAIEANVFATMNVMLCGGGNLDEPFRLSVTSDAEDLSHETEIAPLLRDQVDELIAWPNHPDHPDHAISKADQSRLDALFVQLESEIARARSLYAK